MPVLGHFDFAAKSISATYARRSLYVLFCMALSLIHLSSIRLHSFQRSNCQLNSNERAFHACIKWNGTQRHETGKRLERSAFKFINTITHFKNSVNFSIDGFNRNTTAIWPIECKREQLEWYGEFPYDFPRLRLRSAFLV